MKSALFVLVLAGAVLGSKQTWAQQKATVKKQNPGKSKTTEKPVPTGVHQTIVCGLAPDAVSDILAYPDVMPVFKHGGLAGLQQFLKENRKNLKDKTEGMVVTSFVVDTLGQISDVQIIKSLSDEANLEAIRLTNLLVFDPGKQNYRKVKVRFMLPIRFRNN